MLASQDKAPLRVLALVGPTASGKSEVALHMAKMWQGEIIACDALQVYQGFDIGTAKASRADQACIPHHLLDVIPWDEPFDAGRYVALARHAIGAIGKRHRVAIVCGGTGLYLRALRYGLLDAVPADPALRRQLHADEAQTPGILHQRLAAFDPQSAQQIQPSNLVYLIRALEIFLKTGEPASRLRSRHGFRREQLPMKVIFLRWPMSELRRRIYERSLRMLEGGWVEEVQSLLASGVSPSCKPMLGIGYQEIVSFLNHSIDFQELHHKIFHRTWHYARRQATWLRKEKQILALDMETTDPAFFAEGVCKMLGLSVGIPCVF